MSKSWDYLTLLAFALLVICSIFTDNDVHRWIQQGILGTQALICVGVSDVLRRLERADRVDR